MLARGQYKHSYVPRGLLTATYSTWPLLSKFATSSAIAVKSQWLKSLKLCPVYPWPGRAVGKSLSPPAQRRYLRTTSQSPFNCSEFNERTLSRIASMRRTAVPGYSRSTVYSSTSLSAFICILAPASRKDTDKTTSSKIVRPNAEVVGRVIHGVTRGCCPPYASTGTGRFKHGTRKSDYSHS